MPPGMPLVRLPGVLAACLLLPSSAAAQAWLGAYNAREYEKAAGLLHEIVTDQEFVTNGHDPLPARHLAVMYANGLGVTRDPVVACALAQDAEVATHMASTKKPILTVEDGEAYQAGINEANEFTALHCGRLSARDHRSAGFARGGCYGFGMPEQVVIIDRRSVRIDRAGFAFADAPDHDASGSFQCPVAISRVRLMSIEPPDNAAPGVRARHFVEAIVWRGGTDQRTQTRRYAAIWQIYEVGAGGAGLATEQPLEEATRWPAALVSPNLDARVTMEMVRSGHVRWVIDGSPPRRGWLMLPEKDAPR